MWIVETGINYLGTEHFVVEHTRKFRLEKNAKAFLTKMFHQNCKGGRGYWHHMPVPSVRMRKE